MPESRYRLEVESLDLGANVRAVGLELIFPDTREPVTGVDAARIWAALVPALAGSEPWLLDFFAHLGRVRDFCNSHEIAFREPNSRVLTIPNAVSNGGSELGSQKLFSVFERFAAETFGARAGKAAISGDGAAEDALALRGVDAYEAAFKNYALCAVFDIENGFLTVLSDTLWASEIIRRARAALAGFNVEVTRPPD